MKPAPTSAGTVLMALRRWSAERFVICDSRTTYSGGGSIAQSGLFASALRPVPAQQVFFQPLGEAEDHQHDDEDQKNQREHQGSVVGALRK